MKYTRHFIFVWMAVMLTATAPVFCQSLPDSVLANGVALRVTVADPFRFGVYAQGTVGGEVMIAPEGTRTVSGTIVPLNFGAAYNPLTLEVEAPKGSIVSVYSTGKNVLTGSNGGRMLLRLGNMEPVSPFYITEDYPQKTRVIIGGILSVGNAADSPPGNYSGNVFISFVVE